MAAFYNAGTCTLTASSTAVTGQGTNWNSSLLRAGDTLVSNDGRQAVIASVNNNTSITLTKAWQGTGQTAAPYVAWYTPEDVDIEGLARTALQASASPNLLAFAALDLVANRLPYANGTGTLAQTNFTSQARQLLDDGSFSAMRETLGLEIGTNVQAYDAQLAALAGLTGAAGSFVRWTGASAAVMQAIVGTVSRSGSTPTGALSTGWQSHTNGWWLRREDGLQVCMLTGITLVRAAATRMDFEWSYPSSFPGSMTPIPFLVLPWANNQYVNMSVRSIGSVVTTHNSSSTATLSVVSASGSADWPSDAEINNCRAFAIGGW